MADRTIQIIVDIADKTGGKTKAIADQLVAMDKAAQRLNNKFKSFATMKYAATLRLIDRVTEPASRINSILKKIAGSVYNISIRLADGALSGVRKIETALMKLTSKAYNISVNMKNAVGGKMNNLMSGAMMGAGMFMPVAGMAGVGFGVANAIQASAGFEQQMSKVQAIRELDKDSAEMKALTQKAKDLGMTTAWTRQQVGEAMQYQALAGWDTERILQATPHILNLASAGGIDLGRTSDIVTDAMTAFGLKADENYINKQGKIVNAVEHFADMLAKMQAVSNTDISQAGEAFKYSANVIGAMFSGQDISKRMQATEDAMIMTGLMANAGIKGSMAGTATRAAFTRMASMNRNAKYALEGLGVDYKDEATGNLLLPGEIMRNLSRKFKEGVDPNELLNFAEAIGEEKIHADTRRKLESFIEQTQKNGGKMGSADMAKMAAMLAGQEAMSGLLAVLMGDWDAMAEKMDNVNGTAEKMAKTMMDNLAGSFTYLGSAWDAFQQDLFTGTAGDGLRGFVDSLTELLTKANNLFKDGIDIGDFGKILGDVVNRLKNKFLELDGIGSILAGGALAAGLMKIITLSQKAMGALKGVQTAQRTAGGLSAAQKVGTMTVSAGVVNVNGKISGAGGAGGVGGKVGNQTIIDNYNRTKERIRGGVPPTPSIFSGMKSAAAGGAAFAGIFSVLDILNTKSIAAERLANATDENRAQIIKENRQMEWEAGGGAVGSVTGAALGAALGSMAGPMGTAIGGIVGGMIGQYLGVEVGKSGAERENQRTVNEPVLSQAVDDALNPKTPVFFDTKPPAQKTFEDYQIDLAKLKPHHIDRDFLINLPVASADKKTIAESEVARYHRENIEQRTADFAKNFAAPQMPAVQQAQWATPESQLQVQNSLEEIAKHVRGRDFSAQWQGNDTGFDFYQQRARQMAANPDMLQWQFQTGTENRAHASELNEEQMAQMAAMEAGNFYPSEQTTPELPELNLEDYYSQVESLMESVNELMSGFGESITENLTSAFEGVGEIFSTFGESITEGLTSTFEGAGEIFSTFGEGITEGLTSTFEGAGEIFSQFGELVTQGLTAAQESATSSLEAINTAFTSTKEQIQSSWAELPAFFSGIFDGLGGVAAAAGSAIEAGLTAPIGSIIAAWSSAAATISSIISSISAQAAAMPSIPSGGGLPAHAEGGFITSPEIALIGEKGAELILPLTDRERSMELLGESGLLDSQTAVLGTSTEKSSESGGDIQINLGGITFNVSGNVENLKENLQEFADEIAAHISAAVQNQFKNQCLE